MQTLPPDSSASAEKKAEGGSLNHLARPICPQGLACSASSSAHLRQFWHPHLEACLSLPQLEEAICALLALSRQPGEAPSPRRKQKGFASDGRPKCRHGRKCHRSTPSHFLQFWHPIEHQHATSIPQALVDAWNGIPSEVEGRDGRAASEEGRVSKSESSDQVASPSPEAGMTESKSAKRQRVEPRMSSSSTGRRESSAVQSMWPLDLSDSDSSCSISVESLRSRRSLSGVSAAGRFAATVAEAGSGGGSPHAGDVQLDRNEEESSRSESKDSDVVEIVERSGSNVVVKEVEGPDREQLEKPKKADQPDACVASLNIEGVEDRSIERGAGGRVGSVGEKAGDSIESEVKEAESKKGAFWRPMAGMHSFCQFFPETP